LWVGRASFVNRPRVYWTQLQIQTASVRLTRGRTTAHPDALVAQRIQAWRQWPNVKQANDRVKRMAHRGFQRLCVLMRKPLGTGRRHPTVRRPRVRHQRTENPPDGSVIVKTKRRGGYWTTDATVRLDDGSARNSSSSVPSSPIATMIAPEPVSASTRCATTRLLTPRHRTSMVFSTWSGKPISPNNVLRRWVFPACAELGLPNVSWLTFRRTYASWAHHKGVPGKVQAKLMGHEKVDTSVNVYSQVIDGAQRAAAERVGCELKSELITIDHAGPGAQESTL